MPLTINCTLTFVCSGTRKSILFVVFRGKNLPFFRYKLIPLHSPLVSYSILAEISKNVLTLCWNLIKVVGDYFYLAYFCVFAVIISSFA